MLGTLTRSQIEHVLRSQTIGRIACCVDDEIYIVPVTYVCAKGYIYAHSKEGQKIRFMRRKPRVCFQVDAVENMANWRSVVVWGTYEELKTERDRKAGMKIIIDRLMPLITSATAMPSHVHTEAPRMVEKPVKAVVYRIKIEKATGRFEKNPSDESNHYYHK